MNMHKIILRYGVFVLLFIMVTGIVFFLERFEIREKSTVQIFVVSEHLCRCYTELEGTSHFQEGDTLEIEQTITGNQKFVLDSTSIEPQYRVWLLRSPNPETNMKELFQGNSYTQGFIFKKKIKLRKLVLRKLQ